jgi:hypothetical protein
VSYATERHSNAALVHIGTHKTGTTAFQRWATTNRSKLEMSCGFHYYEGLFGEAHYEVPMLCLRPDRDIPMRVRTPEWRLAEWQDAVTEHVRAQAARPVQRLVISAEGLSYARDREEVARLAELLQPRTVAVVVVLRNPSSFLASYRAQLERQGFAPSRDPRSFAYTEADTWLTDYSALVDAYTEVLGRECVTVLSYERSVERHGSIVPALVEALGFDATRVPNWQGLTANVTASRRSKLPWMSRFRSPFSR